MPPVEPRRPITPADIRVIRPPRVWKEKDLSRTGDDGWTPPIALPQPPTEIIR
jgi:hypothetical protein